MADSNSPPDANIVIQTQPLTTFVDDAPTVDTTPFVPLVKVPQTLTVQDDSDHSSIYKWLARPQIVNSIDWSSTTAALSNHAVSSTTLPLSPLASITFPIDLINSSLALRRKLENFAFFRANVRVRVVVNASPFQSGRLWCAYTPYFDTDSIMLYETLSGLTGFPGIEIDVASGSVGEFTIPYCSPYAYFDLIRGLGTFGELRIYPLSALSTGTAEVKVFAWFENPELSVAAPISISSALSSGTADITSLMLYGGLFSFLSGQLQKHGESEVQSTSGVVSSVTAAVGKAAGALGEVPVVGTFLKPVGWVANIASRVASTFGWSVPNSVKSLEPIVNLPGFGASHVEGLDFGVSLSAFQNNSIVPTEYAFGTSDDEMDLSYATRRPSVYAKYRWAVADGWPEIIGAFPVTPFPFRFGCVNPPLLSYVTSFFSFWRGSLKYRVAVTKTGFHSGRLRIAFSPSSGALNPSASDSYNFVLDLRETSEITFTIPFVFPAMYAPVIEDIGRLEISVLNSLRAPDNVAQTVDVFVWISGGDDFELAAPTSPGMIASFVDPETRLPPVSEADEDEIPHAQMLQYVSDDLAMQSTSDDMSLMPLSPPVELSPFCIGERIHSLRQLSRRFSVTNGYSFVEGESLNEKLYRSFTHEIVSVVSTTTSYPIASLDSHTIATNILQRLSMIYRFNMGSIRYKVVPMRLPLNNMSIFSTLYVPPASPPAAAPFNFPGSSGVPFHITYPHINPVHEISIPAYTNGANRVNESSADAFPMIRQPFAHLQSYPPMYPDEVLDLVLLAAGGDDFSFGWLTGAPQCAIVL
nr:MAG: capsid protein [Wufeng shrew dicistrovirus 13]